MNFLDQGPNMSQRHDLVFKYELHFRRSAGKYNVVEYKTETKQQKIQGQRTQVVNYKLNEVATVLPFIVVAILMA